MKLYIDSSDETALHAALDWGIASGVTLNPTSLSAVADPLEFVRKLCDWPNVPEVSVQVTETEWVKMVHQGQHLHALSYDGKVVVKLPATMDGIKACYSLSRERIRCNVTLCFSAAQALLAANAGAYIVSAFVARAEDAGITELIKDIRSVLNGTVKAMPFSNSINRPPQLLAASLRTVSQVINSAQQGADIATVSPELLAKLVHHPLTESGLAAFLSDWKKSLSGFLGLISD